MAKNSNALPLSILLPYQQKWVEDKSTHKIGCWSRQSGKSFACAAEAVKACMVTGKDTWVVLSVGERQAIEFLGKAKDWAEVFDLTIKDYAEDRSTPQSIATSAQITFSNDSRIIAIPARPETARGYTANLILDEFAFHDNADKVWRSIYPSITNRMKGVKKLRIVSTPGGTGNKFARLWNEPGSYSRHKITIHQAAAQGLKVNVQELKAGLADPDAWAQEYECEFADSSAVLLPYELIALAENEQASEVAPEGYWNQPGAFRGEPVDLGIDFGRKRDLTVCWSLATVPGGFKLTREVLTLEKMSTPDQVEILRPRIQRARRVCLDYTGAGVGMGDYLAKEFGEYQPEANQFGKIELCQFTPALKQDIFPKLRMEFEGRKLGIPPTRNVREDLHAVHRVVSTNGTISYSARHTADGHSDRAAALALAIRATTNARHAFHFSPVEYRRSPFASLRLRRIL